ncbi:MAG TPA: serine/threonine-protein kinase [Paucimonas sp.]|nr:serine/threonine-protein kinase [Paucimonas sp.]
MTALQAPPAAPKPAHQASPAISRIGRFYITRELGRGSVGTVYLGHDPVIDRAVAIKTFNPARLTAAEKRQHEQQFINEARAAGRLSHPRIVTIYDASSEGGTTYIAMEFLEGRELNRMLDGGHRFSADDVASIIWKVADALGYAHRNGVVHRDIKPANIFIVGERQPKVVDFGIARAPNRVSDQASQAEPYTMFHQNLLGTPNYMSPEQALGRDVDHRTDLYSLGAVMYEMLTGKRPFRNAKTEELLDQIAYKAPPAPHDLDPAVPHELSQIAMKAMSKKPEKRYQDAEELVLDLKRFLARERRRSVRHKEPPRAEDGARQTAPKPASPRPARLRGIVIAAALVGAACLSYLWLR